ncbi:hypothetical protein GOV09_05130 [Candidatus Woesearchaeota archaeon]|nr:hypothetical protein [Candidatus Woesearchaeota archaeon]
MTQKITTGLGDFSVAKFNALVNVREHALDGLREALKSRGYSEVTTSTLVNIAGSCENPHASFTLPYYGREAHLSQSAQIQLEKLVIGLNRGFFTVNNSFREENFDDPDAEGRRLSEFTLVEPERPYVGLTPGQALDRIIEEQEQVIKQVIGRVVSECAQDVEVLGGDLAYLKTVLENDFHRMTYDDALALLNQRGGDYEFGHDLDVKEEREILKVFDNIPVFVTHYPTSMKFFNMKRMPDGQRVYSVDLLMPRLGESTGGAVREEDGEVIKDQLRGSKIGTYLSSKGQDPVEQFADYFNVFTQTAPLLRGGYGVGFERLVGFLLQSNDILETVAHRTMHPD